MPSMPMQIPTDGFSDEARLVARTTSEQRARLIEPHWVGFASMREDLGAVWDECRLPNWDGFGALPVSHDTLRSAYCFLESLPLDFPPPSIGAEPDGQLTLEWHRSARRTLSISVSDGG